MKKAPPVRVHGQRTPPYRDGHEARTGVLNFSTEYGFHRRVCSDILPLDKVTRDLFFRKGSNRRQLEDRLSAPSTRNSRGLKPKAAAAPSSSLNFPLSMSFVLRYHP